MRLNLNRLSTVWVLVFLYTLLAGLLMQFVVLPHLLPSWHEGDGILKGMDGPQFHDAALALSERIKAEGWSAWELYPDRQFVAGVMAIFYTLIYPKPWSILPLNATLNASAAVCMVLLMEVFLGDRRRSLIAALPFVVFPSSMVWHTQMHNENYAVPAVVALLLGWAMLAAWVTESRRVSVGAALLLITLGSWLQAMVRDYILFLMLALVLPAALALAIAALRLAKRSESAVAWWRKLAVMATAAGIMAALTAAYYWPLQAALLADQMGPSQTEPRRQERTPQDSPYVRVEEAQTLERWEHAEWMPAFLDEQLLQFALTHNRMRQGTPFVGSIVDPDTVFLSAGDIAAYVPRALHVALLSPFPNIWFASGRKVTSSGLRLAVIPETIAAYACLLALPYFLWKQRRSAAVWTVVFLCFAMLVFYGLAVPNAGALQRFRFPYYLPLVCMGLAGWLEIIRRGRSLEAASKTV